MVQGFGILCLSQGLGCSYFGGSSNSTPPFFNSSKNAVILVLRDESISQRTAVIPHSKHL